MEALMPFLLPNPVQVSKRKGLETEQFVSSPASKA